MLHCDFAVRRGNFALQFKAAIAPGITALWGESGAGKTTALRVLAGLELAEGAITIAGTKPVVGYAPQGARLFPHLNVLDNLRFGAKRVPAAQQWCDENEIIAALGLGDWLTRKPHELSGGQQQRVALGRALLNHSKVLLLDEPFSALDNTTRQQLGAWLKGWVQRHAVTCVLVSHARDEVLQLADEVIWLADGIVQQQACALTMAANWRGPFADHQACAVLPAQIDHQRVECGLVAVQCAGAELWLAADAQHRERVRLLIHARDVALSRDRLSQASIQNAMPVEVDEWRTLDSSSVLLRLRTGEHVLWAQITERALRQLQLQAGDKLFALIKAVAMVRND